MAESLATAQQVPQPQPPSPPPQMQPPPPPPQPPLPPPPMLMAGPSAEQLNALEAHGRRKKRVGAILMGTGGAILAAGTALMIAGAWDRDDRRCYNNNGYYYSDGYYYSNWCGDTALTVAGATTSILGIGALVPGIVIYVGGGSDVAEARRLRRACAGVCW
jgi:hypothetical protein